MMRSSLRSVAEEFAVGLSIGEVGVLVEAAEVEVEATMASC